MRPFWMEDWLERWRFTARFNLGESGGRPRTLRELCALAGYSEQEAAAELMALSLRDSPNMGEQALRAAIARLHPGAGPENVLVTTGTSEALYLLLNELAPKRLALVMPAFQLLYEVPRALGASVTSLPVTWDEDRGAPRFSLADWCYRIARDKPDVILINHPHNPSGLTLTPEELGEIAQLAAKLGSVLIGDEHYRFLASEDSTLGPTLYRPGGGVFVTGSFIKCLGCPGLRIGWCVGDPEVLDRLQSEKNYLTHTVNPLSQWLAQACLAHPDLPAFAQAHAEWRANRATLSTFLRTIPQLTGVAPAGGLVCSVGFAQARSDAHSERLLDACLRAGVFVLPLAAMEFAQSTGESSGLEGGWGFRLGLGLPPVQFAEALTTLAAAVSEPPEADA